MECLGPADIYFKPNVDGVPRPIANQVVGYVVCPVQPIVPTEIALQLRNIGTKNNIFKIALVGTALEHFSNIQIHDWNCQF